MEGASGNTFVKDIVVIIFLVMYIEAKLVSGVVLECV